LEKFELKPTFSFQLLDKNRKWIGIAVFLVFSFVFYVFAVSLKESLQLFRLIFSNENWQVSAKQYYLLNFLIAYLSVVFGSLFMLEIWFSKPVKRRQKYSKNTQSIIEYVRGVFWAVLYVVFAFTVYMWVVFGSFNAHYCFEFIADYIFLPVLILLFLFFNLWNRFIIVFKTKLKYILGHFLVLVLLASIFAFYVPLKFQNYFEKVKQTQVAVTIPQVKLMRPNKIAKFSLTFDIYIIPDKSNPGSYKYYINNAEVDQSNLEKRLKLIRSLYDIAEQRLIRPRLFVDENVPMSALEIVDLELFKMRIFQRFYVVQIRQNNCNSPSLGNLGIARLGMLRYVDTSYQFSYPDPKVPLPPLYPTIEYYKRIIKNDSTIRIAFTEPNHVLINQKIYEIDQLDKILEDCWDLNEKILLILNDHTSYKDYIKALATLNNFNWKKQNELSISMFNQSIYDLYDSDKIRSIYKISPGYFSTNEVELNKFIFENDP